MAMKENQDVRRVTTIILLAFVVEANAKELRASRTDYKQDNLAARAFQKVHLPTNELDTTILGKPKTSLQARMQGLMPESFRAAQGTSITEGRFPQLPQKMASLQPPTAPPMKSFSMSNSDQVRQDEHTLRDHWADCFDVWAQSAVAWRNVADSLVGVDAGQRPQWRGRGAQAKSTAEAARAMEIWWEADQSESGDWPNLEGYTDSLQRIPAVFKAAAGSWDAAAKLIHRAETSKETLKQLRLSVVAAKSIEISASLIAEAAMIAEAGSVAASWTATAIAWETVARLTERKAIEEGRKVIEASWQAGVGNRTEKEAIAEFRATTEASWETAEDTIEKQAIEEFRAASQAAWNKEELRSKLQEREEIEEARIAAEAAWSKGELRTQWLKTQKGQAVDEAQASFEAEKQKAIDAKAAAEAAWHRYMLGAREATDARARFKAHEQEAIEEARAAFEATWHMDMNRTQQLHEDRSRDENGDDYGSSEPNGKAEGDLK